MIDFDATEIKATTGIVGATCKISHFLIDDQKGACVQKYMLELESSIREFEIENGEKEGVIYYRVRPGFMTKFTGEIRK